MFPNLGHLERYTPLIACVFGVFSREKGISFLEKGTVVSLYVIEIFGNIEHLECVFLYYLQNIFWDESSEDVQK